MIRSQDVLGVYDLHVHRSGSITVLTRDNSRCDDLGINIVDPNDVPTSLTLVRVFPLCLRRHLSPVASITTLQKKRARKYRLVLRYRFGWNPATVITQPVYCSRST